MKKYYLMEIEEALKELNTTKEGMGAEDIEKRELQYGKNSLDEERKESLMMRFFLQLKDLMIIILLMAAIISGIFGDITDTFIILAVVIINAVVGVAQEYKAEKSLDALKRMSLPYAKVRRNGVVESIKSEEIVPGDIVILDAGDIVPADLRLIEVSSLKIEEAALTGESVPSEKSTEAIKQENIVINDMKNIAFSGSSVVYGRGEGVVIATGMQTEVGKIASLLMTEKNEDTPLQKNIHQTSQYITIGILTIAVVTFIVGISKGKNYIDMFMMSISLAVAAIPEGLPAIITIVLAIGVQRMANKNAIIRKLSAVETLGSTEIICTDKTGTLTQNKMTVTEVFFNGDLIDVENIQKEFSSDREKFIEYMVLCNDSRLSVEDGKPSTVGDPTENALINFGFICGKDKNELEKASPRVFDLPFDSDRKMMTVVNKYNNKKIAIVKGATDVLISKCNRVEKKGTVIEMTNEEKKQIISSNKRMADNALRVLAIAYKLLDTEIDPKRLEEDLIFIGLVGMIDPPREEVKEAIAKCKRAGIRTVMITGDHKDTAYAIAKQIGITEDADSVIIGSDLNDLSDEEFEECVQKYSVYARVSPSHKIKIVKAWKKIKKIVAMTGDGVNDAPALKASDIGVGMGITGTDVTKNVSNMILADDNFATIVVSVEEGRHIYRNITKAIQFLLSCNIAEVLTIFIATLMGWTALLPIHILWINLVTDSLPALALGVDKTKINVMENKPRKAGSSIFSGIVGTYIILQGMAQGLITLGIYYYSLTHFGKETAITMAFLVLGLIQLLHTFNVRSNTESIIKTGLFQNPTLWGAVLLAGLLQTLPVLIKPLNDIFKVTLLTGEQWAIAFGGAFLIIIVVEILKFVVKILKKSL